MVINTNTSALTSARLLSESSSNLSKSLARLSSGSRIVSPEDDAAGLAVSTRFDAQINRLNAAQNNVGNAISFSQTQDGFLQKVGDALNRMSELATEAQDQTKTSGDLANYDAEFQKLKTYINDMAGKTFNGISLFNTSTSMGSTATAGLTVTVDSELSGTNGQFNMTGINGGSFTLATDNTVGLTTFSAAATALSSVQTALNNLATDRAYVGANISALNSYNDQMGVLSDNLTAANSRIKDVDVAKESATYAKYNILVQAGTAMLAQANTAPQSALRLLG